MKVSFGLLFNSFADNFFLYHCSRDERIGINFSVNDESPASITSCIAACNANSHCLSPLVYFGAFFLLTDGNLHNEEEMLHLIESSSSTSVQGLKLVRRHSSYLKALYEM
jgi:hypothetical protein